MSSKSTKSRRYSRDFKLKTIELAKEIGISKAAKETGVTYQPVKSWVETIGTEPDSSNQPSYEELAMEVKKLKRELSYSKKINEILKKSTLKCYMRECSFKFSKIRNSLKNYFVSIS